MSIKSDDTADPDDHLKKSPNNLSKVLNVAKIALDSANAGIWFFNISTGEFLPSARTKELFGYLPEQEMTFDQAIQKIVIKYRKVVVESFELALKQQGNLYIEYPVIVPQDHKQTWLSVTGGVNHSDVNNSYFSGIILDITQQKQDELKRSKFIGIVSHELKTPLTALKAYVQMLNSWARKKKDTFSIGALSKVEKQVKKMLSMINGLLNLSGAESGKIPINKQQFILNDLLQEVIEETLFLTASHEIVLLPCEKIKVNADRDKIEQVLVNLLSNAAKYSAKDMPIEISCASAMETIEVIIRDQGMGIAPQHMNKLFLPHYRVESKETEKIDGFGIGLYLCSEIIKGHNGKIWVESELTKGSAFKFTIPID